MEKVPNINTGTRRVYVDLSADIADSLREKAFHARIPMKRYLEALIERDMKPTQAKGKQNGTK